MSAVLVSTKGQIVLPVAVRRALGIKPGMRVDIRIEGKVARITPASPRPASSISDIRAVLKHSVRKVPIKDMRVTDYED